MDGCPGRGRPVERKDSVVEYELGQVQLSQGLVLSEILAVSLCQEDVPEDESCIILRENGEVDLQHPCACPPRRPPTCHCTRGHPNSSCSSSEASGISEDTLN